MSVALCVLGALSHTVSNIVIKKLIDVGPFTVVAGRFLVMLMAVVPLVIYR